MKDYFILFGGSGFIGHNLYQELEERGYKGLVADIVAPKFSLGAGWSYYECDVREEIDINFKDKIQEEEIVVINLAAVHTTPGHESHEYFDTNILGAKNICSFMLKFKVARSVFFSSIAVYGISENNKDENTILKPNIPYGISKALAEGTYKEWEKSNKSHYSIIVRPGIVFGKGEGGNFDRLLGLLKKGIFIYPGRSDTKKACIYVKDVVWAVLELLNKPSLESDVYNLCYTPCYSIKEIICTVNEKFELRNIRILFPRFLMLTISKIIYQFRFIYKKFDELNPERVGKLLISNDISGAKVISRTGPWKLGFDNAIVDWCESVKLK